MHDMELLERVCDLTGAADAQRRRRIQSLWSGYGEVVRVELEGGPAPTVIVKHVRPPRDAHPRKLRSYQVERSWYRDFAPRCTDACRVPGCYGSWSDGVESLFVLEDLDASGFPGRRGRLGDEDIADCLRWLAHLHGTFLHETPVGLWEVGTYWHLATRPDEFARMTNQRLKSQAHAIDRRLNAARFQTLVHGDAKTANFCFGSAGVAAVDFQYVGGGVGIKDVAYFLEGFRSGRSVERWLDLYFQELRAARPTWGQHQDLEREWRGLLDAARLDFARFLDGW